MSSNAKKDQTIVEKLERLRGLTAWFESEDFQLEIALEKFVEAEKLSEEIENDLKKLKNSVTVIKQKFDE